MSAPSKAAQAAAQLRLETAEAEHAAAAQVAAAQLSAAEEIEASLEALVTDRGLLTAEGFVTLARQEAEGGSGFSPPFRQVTAVVMEQSTQATGSTTLPPSNFSGKGRGRTYMGVVKAMKPSDRLGPTHLWERTKVIKKALDEVSGGAAATQLAHFINSNRSRHIRIIMCAACRVPGVSYRGEFYS